MTEESNKPIDEPIVSQEAEPVEIQAADACLEPEETPAEAVAAESAADAPSDGPVAAGPPDGEDSTQPAEAAVGKKSGLAPGEVAFLPEPVPSGPVDVSTRARTGEGEERIMDWYILKVQSNREDSIRDGLIRRVKIAGLEDYFGEIIVPTEKVTEFKGGKKRVTKRKLYPGYIVVNMEINEDTWFLVRETPGIGDFTGAAGTPTPMLPHEVQRILAKKEEKQDEVPKLKIGFRVGDRVKINEGTFENFEGEVHTIDETSGRVTVMINIFGRSTPVELEYWQIESV